jgi:MazG family protein
LSSKPEYATEAGDAFAELIAIVERLRSPGGCPWDADQTHTSLRQYLLEETYELLSALDSGESAGMEEELGDLMTQLAFHTDIGRRAGTFDAATAARKVVQKLIQRHPHVFGDGEKLSDPDEVLERWEALKRAESGRTSVVASLPVAMPALALAGSVQRRAVKAGLPWPPGPWGETAFSRREGETDVDAEARAGEMLMRVALDVRQAGIDPEIALHAAAMEFRERVLRAEGLANGKPLADLSEDERARVWEKAEEA